MSMEITNNYGNYATGYADSARKTSNSNSVEEYYEKLCKKFPQIIPTAVLCLAIPIKWS